MFPFSRLKLSIIICCEKKFFSSKKKAFDNLQDNSDDIYELYK